MKLAVEIVIVIVGTALVAVVWVVVVAAVLMPITYAADWLFGSSVDLLAHPRRNAIVLGAMLFVAALIDTFRPQRAASRRNVYSIGFSRRRRQ